MGFQPTYLTVRMIEFLLFVGFSLFTKIKFLLFFTEVMVLDITRLSFTGGDGSWHFLEVLLLERLGSTFFSANIIAVYLLSISCTTVNRD